MTYEITSYPRGFQSAASFHDRIAEVWRGCCPMNGQKINVARNLKQLASERIAAATTLDFIQSFTFNIVSMARILLRSPIYMKDLIVAIWQTQPVQINCHSSCTCFVVHLCS
ncbi:unnamed protein product [Amoebophrya sp. A25]|nr:unnamed protein product [Amoebophrya sp. A25]|eukprot:GSA25T00019272001.1